MRKSFLLLLSMLASFGLSAQGIIDLNPSSEVLPRLRTARKAAVEWGAKEKAPASWTVLQFSDLHGSNENLERIVTFRNAYSDYLDAAIHMGDAVYCYFDDPYPWENVEGTEALMNIVGNHDCWKGHKLWSQSNRPYDASQADVFRRFIGPFIGKWDVKSPEGLDDEASPHYQACYYYKDYPQSGIRLIVLDCIHYSSAQHEWFQALLSEAAQNKLTVVAAQHYPPQSGVVPIDCGFTDLDLDIDAEPAPQGDMQMERMPDEAYIAVDHFLDQGGQFACWLSGHTHLDYVGMVRSHERQLQIIVDKAGEVDDYMQEDRTKGTQSQDAFNLVTVNPSRGVLFIDRIGCNRDQYMRSKKLLVFDYKKRQIIASE